MRPLSKVAPDWWDYTTLDREILDDAARLTADDLLQLSRAGFAVEVYNTLEEFYLAEALEYVTAWRQATEDSPAGVCGPIGPTEQLPLVARLVNELEFDLRYAHFWAMDEWVLDGKEVLTTHPLSFERANRELCFDRIRPNPVISTESAPTTSSRPSPRAERSDLDFDRHANRRRTNALPRLISRSLHSRTRSR